MDGEPQGVLDDSRACGQREAMMSDGAVPVAAGIAVDRAVDDGASAGSGSQARGAVEIEGGGSPSEGSGTMLIFSGATTSLSQFSCAIDGSAVGSVLNGVPAATCRGSGVLGVSSGGHGGVVDFRDLFPWWRSGSPSSWDAPGSGRRAKSSGPGRLRLPRPRLGRRGRRHRSRVVDAKDLFPWWGAGSGKQQEETPGEEGGDATGGDGTRDDRSSASCVDLWGWLARARGGWGRGSSRAPCCAGGCAGCDTRSGADVPLELREDRQVGHPRLEFCEESGSSDCGCGEEGDERHRRAARFRHPVVFTPLLVTVVVTVFALMAGVYPVYELQRVHAGVRPSMSMELMTDERWRPTDLSTWAFHDRTFSLEFLVCWGGRFTPRLEAGEWWRLFTSPFIHQSFRHLLGNVVLLAALAGHLERDHGPWRVSLVFLLSSLGGNIMSAVFEDGCMLELGASGAVFGFLGLFAVDSVLNFEGVRWPLARMGVLLAFLAFFVAIVLNTGDDAVVSHFSHFGGLLVGLFPPFLLLPNMRRWGRKAVDGLPVSLDRSRDSHSEASGACCPSTRRVPSGTVAAVRFCALMGALVLVLLFAALPVYLCTSKLSDTVCATHSEGLVASGGQHL